MKPNQRLRPLHEPQPIHGAADAKGRPTLLVIKGKQQKVIEIEDRWRIDDEWWRKEISRMYFAVRLEDGQQLTVFHDLIDGGWYEQTVALPKEPPPEPRPWWETPVRRDPEQQARIRRMTGLG